MILFISHQPFRTFVLTERQEVPSPKSDSEFKAPRPTAAPTNRIRRAFTFQPPSRGKTGTSQRRDKGIHNTAAPVRRTCDKAAFPIRYQHALELGFERGKFQRMRELPTLALNRSKHAKCFGLLCHQRFSLEFHSLSSPRLRLSLCWWGEEWQDEGLVKRASAADFVNVGGLLTEGEVSRDGRGRTVEEAVPEGAARSAEADSTVRPRPKFFPPSSDLGLTRPSPFPRGTRRASCSRAFRAACGCCISRSRASPPQSPRPSCGSSSRGNIRP